MISRRKSPPRLSRVSLFAIACSILPVLLLAPFGIMFTTVEIIYVCVLPAASIFFGYLYLYRVDFSRMDNLAIFFCVMALYWFPAGVSWLLHGDAFIDYNYPDSYSTEYHVAVNALASLAVSFLLVLLLHKTAKEPSFAARKPLACGRRDSTPRVYLLKTSIFAFVFSAIPLMIVTLLTMDHRIAGTVYIIGAFLSGLAFDRYLVRWKVRTLWPSGLAAVVSIGFGGVVALVTIFWELFFEPPQAGLPFLFLFPFVYGALVAGFMGIRIASPFSRKTNQWLPSYPLKKRFLLNPADVDIESLTAEDVLAAEPTMRRLGKGSCAITLFIDSIPEGRHYMSLLTRRRKKGQIGAAMEKRRRPIPVSFEQVGQLEDKFGPLKLDRFYLPWKMQSEDRQQTEGG